MQQSFPLADPNTTYLYEVGSLYMATQKLSPFRLPRRTSVSLLTIIILLVAVRVSLPYLIQRYVNRTLDRIPEYDGSIGDVDIALIRGAYSIKDVKLFKTNGKVPIPLLASPDVEFSVQWGALFQGKIVGEVILEQPELNFVRGGSTSGSQLDVDSEWLQVVKDLFPLRINRFDIRNGDLHYRDLNSEPKVDVKLSNVNVTGTNFSNTRQPTTDSVATIKADAKAEDAAPVHLESQIQPAAKEPTFSVEGSVTKLKVPRLNDLLRAYLNVDAESGTLDVYTSIRAEKGRISGSIKPLIKDLSIFRLEEENVFAFIWEGLAGVVAELFTNQRHDQIGTVVAFEGSIDKPEVSLWQSVFTLLRNAFVKALGPGVEGKMKS